MAHLGGADMQREIPGSLENIALVDAVFGEPVVEGDTMTVPVNHFSLMDGHAGMGARLTINVAEGEFVFTGIASSKRVTLEYLNDTRGTATPENPLGDEQQFGEPLTSVDKAGPSSAAEAGAGFMDFSIENGMFSGPPEAGLASWDIVAKGFSVKILKEK